MGARWTACLARQWYPLRLSLAAVPGSVLPACMTLAEIDQLGIGITIRLYVHDKDQHQLSSGVYNKGFSMELD